MHQIKKIKENPLELSEIQNLLNFDGFQLIFRLGIFLFPDVNLQRTEEIEEKTILETKINCFLTGNQESHLSRMNQDSFAMIGIHIFENVCSYQY
jgi:hypothetical protein